MTGPFGSSPFSHEPFSSEHDRARRLAAERLSGPLQDDEAVWLAAHLAWCAPCRAVREEYEAQRLELRSLRLSPPQPPRTLWARTSAAIERQPRTRPVPTLGAGSAVVRGRSTVPVGATSAVLVVALVVGVSMLGGVRILRPAATDAPRQPNLRPVATPFPVPVREVGLYTQLPDGRLALLTGRVDEVCPLDADAGCAAARLGTRRLVDVGAARAQAVFQSPTRQQLIVVGRDANGSGVDLYVVPIRPQAPAPTPPPAMQLDPATDEASGADGSPVPPLPPVPPEPAGSPDATADADGDPHSSADPGADAGADPEAGGAAVATATPDAADGESPGPGDPAAGGDTVAAPSPLDATPDPGASGPAESEAPTPVPVVDEIVEIASDVLVVADVGAYAPDGLAFAFTARPADGSSGPDVYLWRAGEPEAVAVTSDHASVFSDWSAGWLLISRVSGDVAADGSQQPIAVLVDVHTGMQRVLPMASAWRPTVDPTARTAVWWDGTVRRDPSGAGWVGATGRLVLGDWRGPDAAGATGGPGLGAPSVSVDVLAEGPIGEWQARWDETGTRLALWIAEPGNPDLGRLSLFGIDATTGRIDPEAVLVADAPALPGFSIGGGRLAWVRPGEDGSSRVAVVAWTDSGVGHVDLAPEAESLVVMR